MLVLILILNTIYFLHYIFFNENLIKYLSDGTVFYAMIFLNASAYHLLKINIQKREPPFLYFAILISLLFLSPFIIIEKSLQIIIIPLLIIAYASLKGITNKTGRYGDFTYGIYIFAFPVQQMLIAKNIALNNPLKLFCITILIVLPLAILCWHLLEKKMILLKERIT